MPIISPELILEAYSSGYFPMGKEGSDTDVDWYAARKRGIFPLESFHMSKRAQRYFRQAGYYLKTNTVFEQVISGCANRDSTWINRTIYETFVRLHQIGVAHSVEVWRDDRLCGGLYGVALGATFFAESMYQSEKEAMKAALQFCRNHLVARGFELWDVQFYNDFLGQFGCEEISEKHYQKLLKAALAKDAEF